MNDERPPIYPAEYNVPIPYKIRDRHVYVPGMTRNGKTTAMFHMALKDISNGAGVSVLDPKGDLVDLLIQEMPLKDLDRTILIDKQNPLPIDFMSYEQGEEAYTVSELKYIIEGEKSDLIRADAHLEDCLYSLLAVPNTTFLDVYWFFRGIKKPNKRSKYILKTLEETNPELSERWRDDMPKYEEVRPILVRINAFIRNKNLRTVFGEPNPALKISDVMNKRLILLVRLTGPQDAAKSIFGSILVSKYQQEAYRREDVKREERIPHYLYVDELEEFKTESFPKIFSLAGGLGLKLVVGNQYIAQLGSEIESAIFGNAGSYIVFAISHKDTGLFKGKTYPYDPANLALLHQYQAMLKIGNAPPIFKWMKRGPVIDEAMLAKRVQYIKKRTKHYRPSQTSEDVLSLGEDAPDPDEGRTVLSHQPKEKRPPKHR